MSRVKGLLASGAIGLGLVGYNAFTEADRDDSGTIVGGGALNAFEVRVGDCFNDSESSLSGEEEVSSIPAVPCGESHDNEIYAVFDIDADRFPGDDAVFGIASDGCLDRFEGFVGRDYESSALDYFAMYPTRDSWDQMGDREVVCAVYDVNLAKLEGSVRGLGL